MKLTKSCLLGCCLLAALATGCKRQAEPPAVATPFPTASVRVQTVESKTHLATEEVVGTVRARLRATLEARIPGRIAQVLAIPGQAVKAGDPLVRLDAPEVQARLDQALTQRDLAERDFKRAATLLDSRGVTRQEFDVAQSRQRVASAVVAEAEVMLGYAQLTAPFAGVVTRKLVDVGDLAAPGKPLIELEDPAALRLEAELPEGLIGRVRLGDSLPVRWTDTAVGLTGVVSEIAPVADSASRTFLVKLDLPHPTVLRSGQFARVAVPVGDRAALRVPVGAVVQRGQLEIVFVETNRIAQLRLVKTGRSAGGEIDLVSGVEAGERVVVTGAAALRDGQPLEIRP